MQLHFFCCTLQSDRQPEVGDLIGYFYSERGGVEWSSDFTFNVAKGGYVEFRYATLSSSQPSRLRRFADNLIRVLVPLPGKRTLDRYADYLEGAVVTLGAIASILLAGYLSSLVGGSFVKWAMNHHWPIGMILTVGAMITVYVVVQEVRFVIWWYRQVIERFSAYKSRRGQI